MKTFAEIISPDGDAYCLPILVRLAVNDAELKRIREVAMNREPFVIGCSIYRINEVSESKAAPDFQAIGRKIRLDLLLAFVSDVRPDPNFKDPKGLAPSLQTAAERYFNLPPGALVEAPPGPYRYERREPAPWNENPHHDD